MHRLNPVTQSQDINGYEFLGSRLKGAPGIVNMLKTNTKRPQEIQLPPNLAIKPRRHRIQQKMSDLFFTQKSPTISIGIQATALNRSFRANGHITSR